MNKRNNNLDHAISQMSDLLRNQNNSRMHEQSQSQEEVSLEEYIKVLDQKQALVLQILEKEEQEFNKKKQENKQLKSKLAEIIQQNHTQSVLNQQQLDQINKQIESQVELNYSTQIDSQQRKNELENLSTKLNILQQEIQQKTETINKNQDNILQQEKEIAEQQAKLEQEQQQYVIIHQKQQELNQQYQLVAKEFAQNKNYYQQQVIRENKISTQIQKIQENINACENELKKVNNDQQNIMRKAAQTLAKCDEIEKLKEKIQLKIESTNNELQNARTETQRIELELKALQRCDIQIHLERDSFRALMQEKMQLVSQLEKLEHFSQLNNNNNNNLEQILGDATDLSQKQKELDQQSQRSEDELAKENAQLNQIKKELEQNWNDKNYFINCQIEAIKKFEQTLSSQDIDLEQLEEEKKQICNQILLLEQEMDQLKESFTECQLSLNQIYNINNLSLENQENLKQEQNDSPQLNYQANQSSAERQELNQENQL